MPDFSTRGSISLQPNDVAVPYSFEFKPASATGANDGSIPYGDSVASCAVTAHTDESGTDVTSELINSSSLSDNIVTVILDYPSMTGIGEYHLTFVITATGGFKKEFDFNRVRARDK